MHDTFLEYMFKLVNEFDIQLSSGAWIGETKSTTDGLLRQVNRLIDMVEKTPVPQYRKEALLQKAIRVRDSIIHQFGGRSVVTN